MGFTFKEFHIKDEGLGMPVSTDGVLLGAWAPLQDALRVLDIGAGSGLLSLMAAQRSSAHITAIEIDATAAKLCRENFQASPWSDRLKVIEADASQSIELTGEVFTHIICNPPYFETGPLSDKPGRAQARHTHSLSFISLCELIARHLCPQGIASLILPIESESSFMRALTNCKLGVKQRVAVSTVEHKPAKRLLFAIGHDNQADIDVENDVDNDDDNDDRRQCSTFAIRDKNGEYTTQMQALTRDFYLKL